MGESRLAHGYGRAGSTAMSAAPTAAGNVKQAVPFLRVTDLQQSLRYYMNGLGFTMKYKWIDGGKLRWCWLTIGETALMLQEFWREGPHAGQPEGKLGQGVSLVFICENALAIYREITSRGIEASEPQVGNAMWVTVLHDPDGYQLQFESPTDTPEETKLSEMKR